MTRRFRAAGEAISLPPGRIAEARAEGAGGGWPNFRAAVMDQVALTVRLRTREGEKLKLMMMLGGSGLLGGLGGGETQRQGVEALAAWFAEHEPRSGP